MINAPHDYKRSIQKQCFGNFQMRGINKGEIYASNFFNRHGQLQRSLF